jgi:hypothetical protein
MEHPAGRAAEPMARFIERLSGRPTDHQTSRVLLETQPGRAMEQQASRAMEQQASRAMEQQPSRAMEQQASRAMEQQAETIPDWTSFLEGFTPAELGELLKINMANKVVYNPHLHK